MDFTMREGDLLFKDLDCGVLCQSIEGVTAGYRGAQISHVGILDFYETEGQWIVIEAIGRQVQATHLADFFKAPLDDNNQPKILLGRLENKHCNKIEEALHYCHKKLGTPYDEVYLPGEDELYCSELIQYAFGKDLFTSRPMTFRHPGDSSFYRAWRTYYRKRGVEIPEGKLGTNPGALSRHPSVEILHIFGNLDGLTSTK